MQKNNNIAGFTLAEILVSMTVFTLITYFGYLAYANILESITRSQLRNEAISLIENEIEIIRNMPYSDIGISGGYPIGKLLAEKNVSSGGIDFKLKTTVRNIDDPFDGVLGGSPNDTAPADYKIIEFEVNCLNCRSFIPFSMTSTIAPKGLESASNNGSLFINVFDANGQPISGADVQVINNALNPVITVNDITNNDGILQLVDFPTSTSAYEITVSKSGYTTEKTYPIGGTNNPNPSKPHATVAQQQVTSISFSIDKTSILNIFAIDKMCVAAPNIDFLTEGIKLIGTEPDVLKYSATSTTNTSGQKTIGNIEWDNYNFTNMDGVYDFAGISSLLPFTINPNTTFNLKFVMEQKNPKSVLIVVSENGEFINDVSINLKKTGYDKILDTGRNYFSQTDWSGTQYFSQSGNIDNSVVGEIKMLASGGKYSTSTEEWLVSNTFDLGTASTTFFSIDWQPTIQPVQTGTDSLRIQIAGNNDNNTWNFLGPDGAANTFYTATGTQISAIYNGSQYLRYKIFMKTQDENFTPSLENISFNYRSSCIVSGQVLFSGLSSGAYDLTAQKSGYQLATSTISISNDWQENKIEMIKL